MLNLKADVRILGLKPEALLGIVIVKSIYDKFGYDCEITSVVEGKHSRGSIHYTGFAADFGTRKISIEDQIAICAACKTALGPDFDFIKESNHFHMEFQPKRSY